MSRFGSDVRHAIAPLAVVGAVICMSLPVSTQQRPARRSEWVGGHEVVAGEVLLKYRRDRSPDYHAQLEAAADADVSEAVSRRGVRRMRSRRLDAAALVAMLRQNPDIEYAEPNYVLYAGATPNDPYFPSI
jgi:hypothetical protein